MLDGFYYLLFIYGSLKLEGNRYYTKQEASDYVEDFNLAPISWKFD